MTRHVKPLSSHCNFPKRGFGSIAGSVRGRPTLAKEEESLAEKTFLAFLRSGERDAFLALEAELLGQSVEKWGALVSAYRALLTLDDIAAEAKLDERFRPKIWWMRSPFPGNFGDILTPYVLWHAFGVMPRWHNATEADGLCIGSTAKFAPSRHASLGYRHAPQHRYSLPDRDLLGGARTFVPRRRSGGRGAMP